MSPLVFYLLILITPATHQRHAYVFNDAYTCTNVISALAAWVLAYSPGASLSACLPVEVDPADWIVGGPPIVQPYERCPPGAARGARRAPRVLRCGLAEHVPPLRGAAPLLRAGRICPTARAETGRPEAPGSW